MTDENVVSLLELLKRLRPDQLERVDAFVRALSESPVCTFGGSDFATESFAHRVADVLRFHHQLSAEPLTKDKFEHAVAGILNREGHDAKLARRGNPGHDLTVGQERWSLKTQADRGIKTHTLHVSKFMELGKGRWESEEDLAGLRDQFMRHMDSYDRIFSLRCFRTAMQDGATQYEYELVEVPKNLLLRAGGGKLRLMHESRQNPKPGYCDVLAEKGLLLFQLYFDGGTERKLQLRELVKAFCIVHATWRITVASR